MKKLVSILLVLASLSLVFAGCSEKKPDSIRVFTLKGPTGMGMSKLISDESAKTDSLYSFTVANSPDEVTAEIVKGNYDIAAVPTNLASVLYKKTEGALVVGAVNTLGVLYVLENGDTIHSVQDLNGKTIVATGQGSTPEYILNYILEANNIKCTVNYLAEHAELATQMTAGKVLIGMLPVPNATTVLAGNEKVRIALNLTEEWEKAAALKGESGMLCQGCIVIRRAFAEQYPNTVKEFMKAYDASVNFVNSNVDEAAQIIETVGIVPKAAVAKKAIPDANIVFITGDEMKTGLSCFLNVLYGFNPAAVGGELPDDKFYYNYKK